MENKINVAELLRKCPEGMELDCTLFSKPLKYSGFEGFKDDYPIRTVAENGEIFWFTKEGCIHNNMYSKCVIFPKGKTSWEGFVPPYPFKDGDICYIKTKDNEHIFIFNCIDNYGIKRYANLTKHGFYKDDVNIVCTEKVIEEFRYATEEEKGRLFKSIKNHGYMWNPEKKCLEKLPRFKNGDVVATNSGTWIGIVEKQESDIAMTTHCVIKDTGDFETYLEEKGRWCFSRLATEDEKQRLFKVIEDNGYKWDVERKCSIKAPKFKDGDIVAYDNASSPSTVFIYRNYNPDWNTSHFVGLSGLTGKFYKDTSGALNGYNPNVRFATKEEAERLFKAIKDNGYKWNTVSKTLEKLVKPKFNVGDKIRNKLTLSCFIIEEIKDNCYYIKHKKNDGCCYIVPFNQEKDFELVPNKFDINTLKPFDQVLVRDTFTDKWHIQFFEKYNNTQHFPFKCVLSEYKQCVPYKGNEHLHDTKDECSDYYKTWE